MSEESKKKCFVVMGFGEKADLATGRTLDLDKTYRIIIKKAVEEAGLECIRADDVIHSGVIDKPMYELLLNADVVVADLSTANANAIYELGVRHALRPYTTIVIAEKQFKFPFDIGHLLIRSYEHLGKGIDAEEADRVREELKKAIQTLAETQEVDSPVHTFLPQLLRREADGETLEDAVEEVTLESVSAGRTVLESFVVPEQSASELMELFKEAKARVLVEPRAEGWKHLVRLLKDLLAKRPKDEYLNQQLALATYKSGDPDPETALLEAMKILEELNPTQTTDPETLGLWGAVHKCLWDLKGDRAHLDEAIRAYEKGFYLKDDYHNGINFAYLLNVRAFISEKREAIADYVTAERVRRRMIPALKELAAAGVKDDEGNPDRRQSFWVRATLIEALVGIGESQQADELKTVAAAEAPAPWMVTSLDAQLVKLERLLAIVPEV